MKISMKLSRSNCIYFDIYDLKP